METNSITPIQYGNLVIGDGRLTLIGGPCMAETRELCLEVAEYLRDLCKELKIQYIFKASYDKANRSSEGGRRGPGLERGLEYLAAVKERFHVPVITDVHESEEVPQVAAVADFLQIPAFLCRQTDLLHAAGRSGLPVNIKKGQFMAPEDMQGALEKVRSTGNNRVMLTERGTTFGYHNLVVDMRSLVTMRNFGVPVVFDATHSVQIPGGLGNASGGRREFVAPLARGNRRFRLIDTGGLGMLSGESRRVDVWDRRIAGLQPARREVVDHRHRIQMPAQDHPALAAQIGRGHQRIAVPADRQMRLAAQEPLHHVGQRPLVVAHRIHGHDLFHQRGQRLFHRGVRREPDLRRRLDRRGLHHLITHVPQPTRSHPDNRRSRIITDSATS